MSTAQPPHREEDSPQAHAAGQQAGLTRSRDRVPGEKKAWAKKARRRHSVAPTKFTHQEGDKLLGRSSSDEPEEPENESPSESLPLDDSPENEQAEEIVEELEVIEEQPDQADEEQPEELAEEQLEQAMRLPLLIRTKSP